mmetsp:Transcript_27853/g.93112  ORF Transcript_27853/g.93112 Transcript_27853/m.93112 type:complete len:252 (+) Transcript_27853:1219-1974(+)
MGQLAEEDGVVRPGPLHEPLQGLPQALLPPLVPPAEPQLARGHVPMRGLERARVALLDDALELLDGVPALEAVEKGQERLGEGEQVHLRRERLPLEPKLALHVRGEGAPQSLVRLHKAKRSVVHGPAREEAVVRVHVALDVAHAEPGDGEVRLARGEGAHHAQELRPEVIRVRGGHLGELAADGVAHKGLKLRRGAGHAHGGAAGVELEVPNAQEGGRRAAGDRAALLHEGVRRMVRGVVPIAVPEAAHAR